MLRHRYSACATVAVAVSLSLSIGCSPVDPRDDGDAGGNSTTPAGGGETGGDGSDGSENLPFAGFLSARRINWFSTAPSRPPSDFFSMDTSFLMPNPNREPNPNYTAEQVGECSIRTYAGERTPQPPPNYLDPGDPGTASIGEATVNLNAGDTRPGHYWPDESVGTLLDLGFDAGETVTFDFPGGESIAAFSGSVDVPSSFVLLAPDLTNGGYVYENGSAFDVAWELGEAVSGAGGNTNGATPSTIRVHVYDPHNTSAGSDRVGILCSVEDTASFTVPADIMARLTDRGPDSTFIINVARIHRTLLTVDLIDGGNAIVQIDGAVEFSGSGIRRQ